jgi:hypothetical protein
MSNPHTLYNMIMYCMKLHVLDIKSQNIPEVVVVRRGVDGVLGKQEGGESTG